MSRLKLCTAALMFVLPPSARADSFDNYFNPLLSKIAETKSAEKVTQLTPDAMIDHSRVLPGITGTFVVVKTNEGRWARLLVQPARHKIDAEKSVPIALIERFVTYREGEERTVLAKGENIRLFHDFRFSLDIGQVVPASLGSDVRFVAEGDKVRLEPVGKAEMYLVTKHIRRRGQNSSSVRSSSRVTSTASTSFTTTAVARGRCISRSAPTIS